MRFELKKLNGQRFTATARFERFGIKSSWGPGHEKTLLLTNVTKDDSVITDHIWFTCGKTFEKLDLVEGDVIQFDARVAPYGKGLRDERMTDYKLSNPSRVTKLRIIN
jgi:hypothetical protein